MTMETQPAPVQAPAAPSASDRPPEDALGDTLMRIAQGQNQPQPEPIAQAATPVVEPAPTPVQETSPAPLALETGTADEPAPVLTPNANQRIQQVIAEKKAAEAREQALLETLAQMRASAQEDLEIKRSLRQHQENELRQRHQAAETRAQLERLKQAGFDENDPSHQLAWLNYQEMETMKRQHAAELAEVRQQMTAAQQDKAVRAYERGLEKSFDETLKDYSVPAKTRLMALDLAYDIAVAEGIADHGQALARAVDRLGLMELVQKKTAIPAAAPKVDPQLPPGALAMKGNTGGRKAGESASGRAAPTPGMDQEDAFFAQFGVAANGRRGR